MSCLFNSLSRFVEQDAYEIRQTICNFLEADNVLFDDVKSSDVTKWDGNTSLDSYVRRMRSTSTWGGAPELKAFCEIWGMGVNVYSPDKKLVASFVPSREYDKIVNLKWSGCHYDPLPDREPTNENEVTGGSFSHAGRAVRVRRI